MKVILKESLDNLGDIGDVVSVKDGYARNFLFPRGLAVLASTHELSVLEARKGRIDKEKQKHLEEARAAAEKLSGVSVTVTVKLSEEGQMYGSVGVAEISKLLDAQGVHVEKRQILLPEPIKELGVHKVPVRLHREVTTPIQVMVVREESSEAPASA